MMGITCVGGQVIFKASLNRLYALLVVIDLAKDCPIAPPPHSRRMFLFVVLKRPDHS
jgi:hypothetical protein